MPDTLWLVQLCHDHHDLPVRLFDDRRKAVEYAADLNAVPGAEVASVFGVDSRAAICTRVVEFCDGVPVATTLVQEFAGGPVA